MFDIYLYFCTSKTYRMSYNVQDIANKIILKTDAEKGDIISNLKLQKLLYYVQGYHLAFFNSEIFDNPLEAWMYGPVVPAVYRRFKTFGHSALTLDPNTTEIELGADAEDLINQVLHEYGQFSAVKLMEMTHNEPPWKEAFPQKDKTIKKETMITYFKTMIDEN